jgi:hypothetical protein
MKESTKRELRIKFYSNDKYLPSYDTSYYYDINDDESFREAYTSAGYRIMSVCQVNPEITVRMEYYTC